MRPRPKKPKPRNPKPETGCVRGTKLDEQGAIKQKDLDWFVAAEADRARTDFDTDVARAANERERSLAV